MITKYRTSRLFRSKIEAVRVERETGNSVWIGGRRSAKRSEFHCYFDTWDEAHKYLLNNASEAFVAAERKLQAARGEYQRVYAMERPERMEIET